jgi:hypothetical protein
MSTWERRLHATTGRPVGRPAHREPARPSPAIVDALAGARRLGVDPDGMAALAAMVRIAAERPGFGTVVHVTSDSGGTVATHRFSVRHGLAGPVVRRMGGAEGAEVVMSTSSSSISSTTPTRTVPVTPWSAHTR